MRFTTEEGDKLFKIIKPYLVYKNCRVVLDDEAPEDIKKAFIMMVMAEQANLIKD